MERTAAAPEGTEVGAAAPEGAGVGTAAAPEGAGVWAAPTAGVWAAPTAGARARAPEGAGGMATADEAALRAALLAAGEWPAAPPRPLGEAEELWSRGDLRGALRQLEGAAPGDWEEQILLARCRMEAGEYAAAAEGLRGVVHRAAGAGRPAEGLRARLLLSRAMVVLGDPEAREVLRWAEGECLEACGIPEYPGAWLLRTELGWALLSAERPVHALAALRPAVSAENPYLPNTLEALGAAYFFLRRPREARLLADLGAHALARGPPRPRVVAWLEILRSRAYAAMGFRHPVDGLQPTYPLALRHAARAVLAAAPLGYETLRHALLTLYAALREQTGLNFISPALSALFWARGLMGGEVGALPEQVRQARLHAERGIHELLSALSALSHRSAHELSTEYERLHRESLLTYLRVVA